MKRKVILNEPPRMKKVEDKVDAVMKMFAAGNLTATTAIVAYGIGSNQGSWSRFANLETRDEWSKHAMESISWFTQIHNVKRSNFDGRTSRHSRFCLTHMDDECMMVAEQLGIGVELEAACLQADEWDTLHGLYEELREKGGQGGIANWKQRTIKVVEPLSKHQDKIAATVLQNLMEETASFWPDPAREEILFNAFVEGTTGFVLGSDGLQALMSGANVVALGQHKVPCLVAVDVDVDVDVAA